MTPHSNADLLMDITRGEHMQSETSDGEWAMKHIKLRCWKVRNIQECKITAEDLT